MPRFSVLGPTQLKDRFEVSAAVYPTIHSPLRPKVRVH